MARAHSSTTNSPPISSKEGIVYSQVSRESGSPSRPHLPTWGLFNSTCMTARFLAPPRRQLMWLYIPGQRLGHSWQRAEPHSLPMPSLASQTLFSPLQFPSLQEAHIFLCPCSSPATARGGLASDFSYTVGTSSLTGRQLWFQEGVVVPEPSAAALILIGGGMLYFFRRRALTASTENTGRE